MEDPVQNKNDQAILIKHEQLPPSPPQSEENYSDSSEEVEIPLPPPTTIPTETLDIDKKTPDAHVPRDPRLIRLTGVHPFNVEPPLSALYNEGFLTSPDLFYVRNHGAVPYVRDEDIPDWEFSVEGYRSCQHPNTSVSNIRTPDSSRNLLPSLFASSLPSMSRLLVPSRSFALATEGKSRTKSERAKVSHGGRRGFRLRCSPVS